MQAVDILNIAVLAVLAVTTELVTSDCHASLTLLVHIILEQIGAVDILNIGAGAKVL